jgi:hypothetical protein
MTSMGRYAAMLSALTAVGASPAFAAERGCAPAPVETEAAVRAKWPDLPDRIRGVLEGHGDVDTCARVRIRFDQATFVLEVALPDGRSTSRSLARIDDVVPTLEALLLLPLPDPRPEAEPVRAAKPGVPATAVARPGDLRPGARDPTPALSASFERAGSETRDWLRLELSLGARARVGDGQTGVGFAALTLFDLRGWLVGFEGARQDYGSRDSGAGATVLELAVLAGRRFRRGDLALDLTVGPALAMRSFGSRVTVTSENGSPPVQVVTPATEARSGRLVGGARVTFRARAVLRLFAGIDGELALAGSAPDMPPGEGPVPAWAIGLILGTTVGTP